MQIDKHTIKVIGTKYDHNKHKRLTDQVVCEHNSTEPLGMKKFCVMLEELADCYDAHHEVEISVSLKQYQYD
jgi:hypothetical protein